MSEITDYWKLENERLREELYNYKQRVKEAIEKLRKKSDTANNDWHFVVDTWCDEMLEELGLE